MTKRHSRSRRSKETPGWMWMLLGLTMGLVVAGYVYVSDVRPPSTAQPPQTAASAPTANAETSAAAKPEPRPQAAASARTPAAARTPPAARAAAAREPAAEAPAAQTSTAQPSTAQAPASQTAAAETSAAQQPSSQRSGTRFQFFEDLPQSEVVVAEPSPAPPAARAPSATAAAAAATAARAAATAATTATAAIEEPGSYMLQVGSFRTHADADRRKASIALLGYESHIQQATVNGDLVHRVLVGPIRDPQALDDARRRFRAQNFDTLVLKAAP